MNIAIDRGGNFTMTLNSEDLSQGLRPSKRLPRDNKYLVVCRGAIGRDGVLCTLEELERLATSVITDAFPYPQIFVLTNMVIVCGETKIYELVNNMLVEKLTVSAGATWSLVDFGEFVYMSNAVVSVVRDAGNKTYSISADMPIVNAMCNNNGQIIVGGIVN